MKGAGLLIAEFAAGFVLMIFFEHWFTRVLGLLALFAFIVTGVFLIASPDALGGEED